MLIVNKKPIIEPIENIIGVLRFQLEQQGLKRFQSIKKTGNSIMVNCPIHKGGLERTPSCGITLSEIVKSNGAKVPAGYAHCFTCGYTATLTQMISDLFGVKDYGNFGAQWLIKNFVTLEIQSRPDLNLDLRRRTYVKESNYVPEKELDSYRYYHPYMFARRMTKEIIERYDVGYDKNTKCLTFPVRDLSGGTLFIARRSVQGKFFNYPKEIEKPLYGIYELNKFLKEGGRKVPSTGALISNVDMVYVTESIINALTVNVYGRWAVATNGCQFSELQVEQMKKLPTKEIVIAYDGDEQGRIAAYKLKYRLKTSKIVSMLEVPDDRDINDLSKNYFIKLKRVR